MVKTALLLQGAWVPFLVGKIKIPNATWHNPLPPKKRGLKDESVTF